LIGGFASAVNISPMSSAPPAKAATAAGSAHLTGLPLYFLLIGLTLTQAAGTMITVTLPSIGPEVAKAFGVPAVMIGYQVALVYAGVVFSMVLGANMTPRLGACRAMQLGLSLEFVGMLLASTKSIALMVPASFIIGAGYAFLTPASSHLLMRFTPPERRNLVFSIKQTGVPLGAMFAAATAPSITLWAGWQATLWAYAGLVLLVVVLVQSKRKLWDDDRDSSVPIATSPWSVLNLLWSNRLLRTLAITATMLGMAQSVMQNYTVTMFVEQFDTPLVQAGLVLSAAQVGGIAGRVFWGWTADRLRDCVLALELLAATLVLVGVACFFLGAAWPVVVTVMLFFVFGATASGWHGAFLSEVARISPRDKVGPVTSVALVLNNFGSILTPLIFAAIYSGLHNYAWTFALIALPAGWAMLLMRNTRRQSHARRADGR
jgi:MFS family permease